MTFRMKIVAIILLLIGLSFCFSSAKSITPVLSDDDGERDECGSKLNWKPDPCTFCSCVNGRPRCFIVDCAPPPCSNFEVPPGQCCPVCPNGPDWVLRD